jgi:transposase
MERYDHYVAVDWAMRNMAIARMTKEGELRKTIDVPSSVKDLQVYMKQLRGKKILTFEETTTSQWLYTELSGYADKILVCDPYRNKLLSDGPKTDKIDSEKLVQLLRGDLLKPVYHSGNEFIYLRGLVSGYEDIVKAGVRFKNQRASLFRAVGKEKTEVELKNPRDQFILESYDSGIKLYEEQKKKYEKEFEKLCKKYQVIKNLKSVPGIGIIGAVKVAAFIVEAERFKDKGHFLSYCGLITLEKLSGGRSYGRRKPRYNRTLKSVFKTAALSCIYREGNSLRDYYLYLIREKNYAEYNARHKVARRIATLTFGVLKSKEPFKERERKES